MTIITDLTTRPELAPVTFSLYRDIHKGIRSELFAVTEKAGRLDAASGEERVDLARHVADVVTLLVSHAEHEDTALMPLFQREFPALGEKIAADHETLDARLHDLRTWAAEAADADQNAVRHEVFSVYIELASFTGAYLEHIDLEERVIMPAVEATVGIEGVMAIHEAILAAIPPDEMARTLPLMLAAMNVDDRTELLGGMRANAPAEAFEGVWNMTASVLTPSDRAAVGRRLGLQ